MQKLYLKNMQLVPIAKTMEENSAYSTFPHLEQTVEFFKRIGYEPPWIGYFALENGTFVGSGAFKGKPVNGMVEIAYGTLDHLMNRGIGTAICRSLVQLSLNSIPKVRITARTIENNNASCRVLEKNGFRLNGTIIDPEDGEVFEWEYAVE